MSLKKKLLKYPVTHTILFWRKYYRCMLEHALNKEEALRRRFINKCHYEPDLKNPKTYNEKLQWLKLHWHEPLAEQCADKVEVRRYVAQQGYEKLLIPVLGVFSSVKEIREASLPEQFVLKGTHGSGMVCLCRDKAKFDMKDALAKCNRWLKLNYSHFSGEWVYKHLKHRIIAEQMLQTPDGAPPCDYKIYCFHGTPKCVMVASGRMEKNLCMDFFTPEWEHLPVKRHNPNSDVPPERPGKLDEMLKIASDLSKPFPHARVDLYCIEDDIYFGEITFFPATGMQPFEPFEYDLLFGSWLDLNKVEKKNV